jgi:hypothetical protein
MESKITFDVLPTRSYTLQEFSDLPEKQGTPCLL